MPDIKTLYQQQFLPARNVEWFNSYRGDVVWAESADEATFRSSEFQKGLWERDGVASIGPGNSVGVPGAYNDSEIVDALWALKTWKALADVKENAKHLDAEFDRILALVSPRHNKRRPSARLTRVFAMLRPYDVVCLMDWSRTAQFRQWLDLPAMGFKMIGQNVIARSTLREALGPEQSLDDAISYSQFAWFAWELINAAENKNTGPQAPAAEEKKGPTDAPKLVLLPAQMQRKGMFYIAGNVRVMMSVVRAAENGIEKEDLLHQIGEEAPGLALSSRVNVLSQAMSLNLLTIEGGVYRATGSGRRLLEGESAANVLTPFFVRSIFGFALILGDLRDSGILTRGEIAKRAQAYYPGWTSEFAPNALVAWMRDLGLASAEGVGRKAKIQLTEVGEYWVSGLPSDLKRPEFLLSDHHAADPLEPAPSQADEESDDIFELASIDAVLERFEKNPDLNRFVFSTDQIRLLHAAMHSAESKRFVLLAGLSGTGKTSMAKAYAQAYCEAKGLALDNHYVQVSVWPDWTDPSGLLGFVNPLATPPVFHKTHALKLLIDANKNPSKPYFLCLDEMNLARVEHYFAPFLSAMEGRKTRLSIHGGDDDVDEIPSSIPWPGNLFIVGTVNMDESTHPFSDKVLDRAFTFEFWNVDLDAWKKKVAHDIPTETLEDVFSVLRKLYDALSPARRHFGYRTCDEVLRFCAAPAGLELKEALDTAVLTKILPKLRGDSGGALPKALADAEAICLAAGFGQSAQKLKQMQQSLSSLGVVRFWS